MTAGGPSISGLRHHETPPRSARHTTPRNGARRGLPVLNPFMIQSGYALLAFLAIAAPAFVLTPLARSWWRARHAQVQGDALEAAFHEVFHFP